VRISVWTKLYFFDFDSFLFLAGLTLALLLFILELAVVHDFANWRGGIGRDFNEVEADVFCQLNPSTRRNDAYIFSLGSDEPYFRNADFVVYPGAGVTLRWSVVWSASDGCVLSRLLQKVRKDRHETPLVQQDFKRIDEGRMSADERFFNDVMLGIAVRAFFEAKAFEDLFQV
jgi:hypothetical protein